MKEKRWITWSVATIGLLVAFFEVTPYVWMLLTSIKPLAEVTTLPPTFWPSEPAFENYAEVWASAPFADYFFNSLVVSISIAVLQALFSCMAGYAFARLKFWGRDTLFYVVLACLMVPAQVRFISTFLLLDELGWINTYAAQIVPHAASALGIFLMRQAFLAVPQELVEAAKIDGAGTLRIIVQVMLPVAYPTLIAFLLFSFVYHWNDYFLAACRDVGRKCQAVAFGRRSPPRTRDRSEVAPDHGGQYALGPAPFGRVCSGSEADR